jgi:DDE superfamily endonuclease
MNTGAAKYPDIFFQGNEFAWADSAYSCTTRMIPVHKRPAADDPRNAQFDKAVSALRVRSEHCIGALKGRWQCLRGLRVPTNGKHEHVHPCHWITVAIILHNMLVEWEGNEWSKFWQLQYNCEAEFDPNDGGPEEVLDAVLQGNGEARRNILVEELVSNNERAE